VSQASGGVLVLAYHALSDTWPAQTTVSPTAMKAQLQALMKRGYRGTTFTSGVTDTGDGPRLAVTFDDASESVYRLGMPILQELGLPGTVFVPTAFPDSDAPMAWAGQDQWLGTPHEAELACMTWSELAELADMGWEIGSHSRSHPHLTELDEETLTAELTGSREDCERALGRPCHSLAYPYSDEDPRVVEAAGRAGYRVAATVPRTYDAATPLRWPRVGVYRDDTARRLQARVWTRSSPRRAQTMRRGAALARRLRHPGRRS
jgi:peptidoglycan/xylan/chitin deacetylase (PgdA/CDA1 family)